MVPLWSDDVVNDDIAHKADVVDDNDLVNDNVVDDNDLVNDDVDDHDGSSVCWSQPHWSIKGCQLARCIEVAFSKEKFSK